MVTMSEKSSQFDYLLNAMILAAQSDNPAEHGYPAKRKALVAYVRRLEKTVQAVEKAVRAPDSSKEQS
jgi:hypothetical protein